MEFELITYHFPVKILGTFKPTTIELNKAHPHTNTKTESYESFYSFEEKDKDSFDGIRVSSDTMIET